MTNPIAVSQRTREAYLAYATATSRIRPDIYGAAVRAGAWDDTDDLQAFACFEAEIRADERERAAKVAESAESWGLRGEGLKAVIRQRTFIANTIRNQKDHDHG